MKYKKITLSEDEIIIPKNIAKKLMYLLGGAIILFNLGAFGSDYIENKKIKKMMIPGNLIELKIPKKLTLKEKENLIYATTKGSQSTLALMYYSNTINKLQEEVNNGDLEAKQQLEEWESLLK
ncbi:MAG: hypothetical protein ACRC1R_00860 [Cetobacterium sp.]|uniref:hypothetical protein n=1 Tax=Cetobacterium sp. TaxID=2071632 RepID=UPI003F3AD872